jgi:2-dehydropantoate 2-reductase
MPHLHHQLLLKLAANATINPLTAILGGGALPNSSLMSSDPAYRLIGLLTRETSEILTAYLHNLSSPHTPPPDVLRLFSAESLEKRIFALCRATAENISSMAVDVGNGKQTEIEHINGYLVSLGSRLGVPTPNHRLVTEMVKFSAGMNGLDANAPGIYRKGLRQWHRDLREITDTKTKERTLALEEKKLELEERRIKLLEAERQEGLVARRAEMKAKQRITQRRYRAARLAAKLGITDLPEGARSSDMLGVPRPEDVAEPVTMGVASSATDAEEGQVSAEPAEAAHWAGVGSQDFVDVVSGIASSKRQS